MRGAIMNKFIGGFTVVLMIFALFMIFATIFGYVISALWNFTLAAAITGVGQIDWYQGIGLYLLAGIFSSVRYTPNQIK